MYVPRRPAVLAAGLSLLFAGVATVAATSPASATVVAAEVPAVPEAPFPEPAEDSVPQPVDDPPPTDLTLEHRFAYSYEVDVCKVLDRKAIAKALRVPSVRVYTGEENLPGSCLLVDHQTDPTVQWNVVMQPVDSPWVAQDSRRGKVVRVAGFKGVVRKLPSHPGEPALLVTRGGNAVYVEIVTRKSMPLATAYAHAGKYLNWLDKTKPAHPKFPEGRPVQYE